MFKISVEWSGWFFAFFIGFLALIYNMAKEFKHKKYVEVWIQKEIDGMVVFSKEKESIGEFRGQELDPKRDGYILKFRKLTKTTFYYSPVNIQDYINRWLEKKYLIVRYLIDGFTYKRELPESQYYTRKLGLSYKWKIFLFLKSNFWNFNLYAGILHLFLSWIVFGILLAWDLNVIYIALIYVIIFNSIIGYLDKQGKLKPKRKAITIKHEFHLSPLNPKEIIIDVYSCYYLKRQEKIKTDGIKEVGYIVGENFYKDKELTEELLKEYKKVVKPEIIEGYAKLQDLLINPNVKMLGFKIVGQKLKEISIPEMKLQRRDFLAKHKYLWEMNQNQSASIKRLQIEIKELHEQINYISETRDKEVRDMATRFILERTHLGNTFKDIVKEIYAGEMIELDWKDLVSSVVRKIYDEFNTTRIKKIDDLIKRFEAFLLTKENHQGKDKKNMEILLKDLEKEGFTIEQ